MSFSNWARRVNLTLLGNWPLKSFSFPFSTFWRKRKRRRRRRRRWRKKTEKEKKEEIERGRRNGALKMGGPLFWASASLATAPCSTTLFGRRVVYEQEPSVCAHVCAWARQLVATSRHLPFSVFIIDWCGCVIERGRRHIEMSSSSNKKVQVKFCTSSLISRILEVPGFRSFRILVLLNLWSFFWALLNPFSSVRFELHQAAFSLIPW